MAPSKSAIKKTKQVQDTGRTVGGYALLAVAAALIAVALFLPADKLTSVIISILKLKSTIHVAKEEERVQAKPIVTLVAPDTAATTPIKPVSISAYDEYVELSTAKGWNPTDPVLKLETTIRKYSQVFEVLDKKSLENTAVLKQYLDLMGQEVKHLLKVLCKSTDRTIDLTPSLHHALDVIQEVVYRLLKLYLGSSKMVYRTAITSNLNHWMYSPLQELTKVAAVKYPHLTINFNARSGEVTGQDNSSALEKATKRSLYNLLPMLLVFGADADSVMEALRISIRQGDDTALALLTMAIVDAASSGTAGAPHLVHIQATLVQELPRLIELAQSLRFAHVQRRLQLVREVFDARSAEEGAAALSNLKSLERFNDYASSEYNFSGCTQQASGADLAEPEVAATAPSGFATFHIVDVFSTTADASGSDKQAQTRQPGYNKCVIDRVDINNITVEDFYQRYVVQNQPVVLTSAGTEGGSSSSSSSSKVAEGWDLQTLLDKFGSIKEVAGAIPYATLFGHTEEVTTLKDFVSSVMRPHSLRMAQQFATDAAGAAAVDGTGGSDLRGPSICPVGSVGYSVSEQYLTGLADAVPGYIFSGVQQNLNKAVRKQMTQSVLQFTQPSSTAAPGLMDLMHSVSVGFKSDTSSSKTDKAGEKAGDKARSNRKRKIKTSFKAHWKSQFYLGSALSGAPFHHHGPAFNMLVYGRKEWTIMPPGRDVYSSAHPIVWLQDGGLQAPYYPHRSTHSEQGSDQPCKIVQNPGEVIFVPRHWTHQVLNLAESVGFAVEIDDYVH